MGERGGGGGGEEGRERVNKRRDGGSEGVGSVEGMCMYSIQCTCMCMYMF